MKRLLADSQAGAVDCVVVYKVVRLSRNIRDFAKIMEVFDKHGTIDAILTGFDAEEIAKFLGVGDAEAPPPDEFKEFDETIPTEHQCPKCGDRWSGQTSQQAE